MAVRDEIREQRMKLKGQGFKAHWEYFWEYYKIHTIVALVLIIFVVTIVRDMLNNKPYALYAIFVNNRGMETQDILQDGFAEYSGIDTENETILVDTASNYLSSSVDSTTVATSEKIMALMSAKELDVFVSDVSTSYHYASQDTFMDLRDVFSQEELKEYDGSIFYCDRGYMDYLASDAYTDYITTGKFDSSNKYAVLADKYNKEFEYELMDPSEMDDPVPVGIILRNSKALDECGAYPESPAVAAVVVNTQRTDNAKKFISFLAEK